MAKKKTTHECGKFKNEINTALYNDATIREFLFGDTSGFTNSELIKLFRDHVKSHLFIDDTIEETDTFIFYDITMPQLHENVKNCQVILYAICHRDVLDDYEAEGYYGNRADVLSQMVEDCLINDEKVANSFGIGELNLDSVDIYNSRNFYGRVLVFSVPNFRKING